MKHQPNTDLIKTNLPQLKLAGFGNDLFDYLDYYSLDEIQVIMQTVERKLLLKFCKYLTCRLMIGF